MQNTITWHAIQAERCSAAGDLRLLNLAAETLRDVVLVTDARLASPGPRILFAAGNVLALTGYSAAELIGRSPRMFQGPRTEPATVARIRAGLADGQVIREEILNYAADGREYWIELLITPIRDRAGRISHFASVQRDVSEQRRLRRATYEAAERERDRLAYDLHDVLSQQLVGISLSLASIRPNAAALDAASRDTLSDVQRQVDSAIAQTRALAHGLAPIRLGAGDLPRALRLLATSLSNAYGTSVQVDEIAELSYALSSDDVSEVYRIAQEAALNAVRHAHATTVCLRLQSSRSHLTVEVSDNGDGFRPNARLCGLGLDSMRYRAAALGGSLEIATQVGRGTAVRLRLGSQR